MPWQESTVEQLRVALCGLASGEGSNVSELCRRFGHQSEAWGDVATPVSRRGRRRPARSRPPPAPLSAPECPRAGSRDPRHTRSASDVGGRKVRRRLQDLGTPGVPAASTITASLRRHDRLDPTLAAAHTPSQRCTAPAPNDLWQIDVTGHFSPARRALSSRAHP